MDVNKASAPRPDDAPQAAPATAAGGWGWAGGRWVRIGFPLLLLALLGFPAVSLLLRPWGLWPTGLGLLGLVGFGWLMTVVLLRNWHAPHTGRAPWALAGLVAVSVALVPAIGHPWLLAASYYLVGIGVLTQRARWWPAVLLGVLAGDAAGVLALDGEPARLPLVLAQVGLFGLAVMGVYRIARLSQEVAATRARLAHALVAEERLRIARDLHDVLGQRLSGIALNSELARRVLRSDPDGAEAGLAEVAAVARETLGEVRATLSGYRGVSLHGELAAAGTLLEGVGCELAVEITEEPLSEDLETCAAWLVREGTTNVLRHAGARHCTVRVAATEEEVTVTVTDDGPQVRGAPAAVVDFGLGLSGLRDRVQEVGGVLEAEAGERAFVLRGRFAREPR